MDKYMTSFTGDRSRSFSGDSDVSLRSSTPISVESEVTGQEAEIQSSLGEDDTSVLSLPDTMAQEQSEDETDTAANTSEDAATAELNAFLGSGVLDKFFTFKQHLSSETRKEGRVTKLVHTGRAICSQASCRAKPNGGKITFTSTSRAHLTLHYKRTHPELVNALAAAIEGMSHRGFKPLIRTHSDSGHKRRRQLSMEESLQFRFNQEESRKKCTRWLVERMIPLDNQDCPYFRDFVLSLNPNYNTISRRTTARDIEKTDFFLVSPESVRLCRSRKCRKSIF